MLGPSPSALSQRIPTSYSISSKYGRTPKLWEVNRNLYFSLGGLDRNVIPSEIPTERDADITAKQVTEKVCGVEATNQFAERQIQSMENCGDAVQKARW